MYYIILCHYPRRKALFSIQNFQRMSEKLSFLHQQSTFHVDLGYSISISQSVLYCYLRQRFSSWEDSSIGARTIASCIRLIVIGLDGIITNNKNEFTSISLFIIYTHQPTQNFLILRNDLWNGIFGKGHKHDERDN